MSCRAAFVQVIALIMIVAAGLCSVTCSNSGRSKRAEAIEHDTRVALPIGSSLSRVQQYLTANSIEFRFDPHSKTVFAVARNLEGSNLVVRKDLGLQFHFDDALKLTRIDTKVCLTGP